MEYKFKLEFNFPEFKRKYNFKSADGVVSKKGKRKPVLKLLENIKKESGSNILNIDSNIGIIGTVISDYFPKSKVLMTESSARAAKISKINLKENNVKNAEVKIIASIEDLEYDSFDLVLYCPKPYEPNNVVKQKILEGCRKLKKNGVFYLSANIKEGGNVYNKYIKKLLENSEILDKGMGNRVIKGIKRREIEYKENIKKFKFEEEIRGIECSFVTREGIFSPEKIDRGTKFLIENIKVNKEDKVLDLACGYGPLGIFASKMENIKTYFTDDNAVSIKYAKKNIKLNNVKKSEILIGDCLDSVKEKFDKILCNPPTHSGKGILYKLFKESYKKLKNGSIIYLVYNKSLDYEKNLGKIFDKSEIINQNNQFKICKSIKK